MGSSRQFAVGAFVVGGFLLFGLGLFMIGDRRRLFDDSFEVHAEFRRLAGLQNGAKVTVAGMEAGEVEQIVVPSSPEAPFRLKLRVLSAISPLVRTDSVASIQTDGIVGNKLIDIAAGSEAAPAVEDGGMVDSREPFELAALMESASEAVHTLDASVKSLRDDAKKAVEAFGETVEQVDSVVRNVGSDLETISGTVREVAVDVEDVVARVKAGEGTLGRFVTDDSLYLETVATAERVNRMTGDAAAVVGNLREMSDEVKTLVTDLRSGGGPTPGLMADLAETLELAREAMSDMAESTESAKRSFLFRGMFEKRGFYDLDALTLDEYLEGGIRKNHSSLRIWIPREALYEASPRGDRLSELGKARIDSAMREILRYPHSSPLMVEGYSDTGALEERFLAARAAAADVYAYIVRKYHRNPNYTAFIAIESMAPQNVSIADTDSRSGVVLSLFYEGETRPAPPHRALR